jgi:hypothetical protein
MEVHMKQLFTVVMILTLCLAVTALGAGTKWQFVKVFPDTTIAFGTGVHGLTVDPAGKIWVGPSGRTNNDSLPNGKATVSIYIYNPDGSETPISRIKIIGTTGASDTLTALCRGARTAPDGNVVYGSGSVYWKINYKTGAGIAKVNPHGSSVTAPAFTSANEMFSAPVLPGNPVKIWDNSFSSLGTAVTSSLGYSRTLEVSKDGNDIYWCGYSTTRIYKYHSDVGTLGTYALADSFGIGMQCESIAWNKKDGYLYASSGNEDTVDYTPPIKAPWTHTVWYAFDVATKTVKDSIVWNWAAYPYNRTPVTNSPRPRAIDFSVTGDTAYVACYNHAKAAIQMFRRVVTSVEPVDNAIPDNYTLSQNYPNPFNPSTEIQFTLKKAGMTTLTVYDVLGKEVRTLVNEELVAGTYKSSFDATGLSSGTYIYVLTSNGQRLVNKMVLMK